MKSSSGPSADARSSAAVARAISASTCALLCSTSARASPRAMKSQPAARGKSRTRDLPHGVIGQSFALDHPRQGKRDVYPREGRFVTTAMAEGALDGTAASYEVVSPFATAFTYTRFDAPQLSLADGSEWALPLTGVADEAAASDELQ